MKMMTQSEYNTTQNLRINNTLIPTVKNPKILVVTLDPKLNFTEHTRITKEKADKSLNIVKALTSTTWGKQKETLIAIYKTITRLVIEYRNTLWSPIISDTNLNKLQTTQNTALRIIPGCTRRHKYTTSTHRNTNTPTQYPPQTPGITTQTKSSTSCTSSSLTHKAKPKSQTNETNNFRKHFVHHKP